MKTIQVQLYTFEELSDKAKERVLSDHRDINTDYEWWDFTYEDWYEKLTELGYNDCKIWFSGFASQGDGACFECKSVDVKEWIKAHKAESYFPALTGTDKEYYEAEFYTSAWIQQSGHYYHEYSISCSVEYSGDNDETDKEVDELQKAIIEDARDLSRQIYKELESEYDGLTSDEAIIDTINANEYTFEANGEMRNE